MAELKIDIPKPPEGIPESVQKKWLEAYQTAFKEAVVDFPEDAIQQKQMALRDANKILRTPDITSYEQAMKLESWHFILREPSEHGSKLRVVTRHGKKFIVDIPAKSQQAKTEPTADSAKG